MYVVMLRKGPCHLCNGKTRLLFILPLIISESIHGAAAMIPEQEHITVCRVIILTKSYKLRKCILRSTVKLPKVIPDKFKSSVLDLICLCSHG